MQQVVIDATKYLAKNVCPGGTPEYPRENGNMEVLLPDDVPSGKYSVVVRAPDPRNNLGATGAVERRQDGVPVLHVNLQLEKLAPGPYIFSFGFDSRHSYYCDMRLQ